MGMPGTQASRGLRAHRARALVVLAVSAVVAVVAAGLFAAGTDRAEVLATLLFVPVFAAGLLGGRRPGWVAAAVATVVYLALRSADVDDAGLPGVVVLAATRALAYAVAAEVGLRAQSLAERLSEGNEWDDSPLVARGRALSKRERPGHDSFEVGEPTSVWVTRAADAPTEAGAGGTAWGGAVAPTASDTGWSPHPPEPDAWSAEPSPPSPGWSDPYGSPAVAGPPGSDAWPGGPPPSPPPAWSDPYGSPAVSMPPPPAPAPASWSDPYGSPAVPAPPPPPAPAPAPWSDPYGSPAVPAPPVARPRPSPPPPPIDGETRLWTARFLCDRIAAEQAHCQRTGSPFSLVLVQVPDEPFAALPYRRQVTLLRELGHQLVAGGVVDHLVHVPDREQHWFAVVLPDLDRAGAQVLERRLRTGIGGYLRSRGLPLPALESASLTSPDDDAALGEIWEALASRGDPGGATSPSGAMAYGGGSENFPRSPQRGPPPARGGAPPPITPKLF